MGLVLLMLSEACEERFAAWGSSQLGSGARERHGGCSRGKGAVADTVTSRQSNVFPEKVGSAGLSSQPCH